MAILNQTQRDSKVEDPGKGLVGIRGEALDLAGVIRDVMQIHRGEHHTTESAYVCLIWLAPSPDIVSKQHTSYSTWLACIHNGEIFTEKLPLQS